MSKIIAVSKSSKNVLTSTDPNDFIFHSAYNTFKILESGTAEFSFGTAAGFYTGTINHSVGNPACFLLFVLMDSQATICVSGQSHAFDSIDPLIVPSTPPTTSVDRYVDLANITSTTLKFEYCKISNTGTDTIKVKYYIFETPLA